MRRARKIIVRCLTAPLLFLALAAFVHGQSKYRDSGYDKSILMPWDNDNKATREYRRDILRCLALVNGEQNAGTDWFEDGMFDCIDATLVFKWNWDKMRDPWLCEIVYTKIKGGRAHLFVRVKRSVYHDWEYVEPQAYGMNSYFMEDVWGERYDPTNLSFGERNSWVSKANNLLRSWRNAERSR